MTEVSLPAGSRTTVQRRAIVQLVDGVGGQLHRR